VDCGVLGIKAPSSPSHADELIRAYVVLREGTSLTEDEVRVFVRKSLASYKAVTGGVVFVKEIPKSPSGKILKRVLKEMAEREMVGGKAKL
jgi:4-coumarate--CoA ligase